MALLATILSLCIAALSIHTLQNATRSLPKLRKYETKAEKAAKWSNVAEKRLRETRRTVAAGLLLTTLSLLSSLYYALYGKQGFAAPFQLIWIFGLAVAEFRVSEYIKSFWASERKVPLLDDYNDAIADMVTVMDLSAALGGCWGIMGVVRVFGY